MQYPLPESIVPLELLVCREKEFATFNKWIARIPERLSKSRAILACRKSGSSRRFSRWAGLPKKPGSIARLPELRLPFV